MSRLRLRWWKASHYDVTDFGARGDGVHDDTAAFQAAFDAAARSAWRQWLRTFWRFLLNRG